MGYQDVSQPEKYYKYNELEPDTVIVEGHYIGEREGKFGIQHQFRDGDSVYHVLNSSGHLNWLLENRANVGDWCMVTYLTKEELTSGTFAGKEAHKFQLQVDPDRVDTTVVGAPSATVSGGSTPEDVEDALL